MAFETTMTPKAMVYTGNNSMDYNSTDAPNTADGSWTETENYIIMAMLIVLSIIGTVGNALVMFVFSKKREKVSSTYFIMTLSFTDFVTCVVIMPMTVYLTHVNHRTSVDFLCKIYQFLITSNVPYSAFIMAAIAVDRYLCICHPFARVMTNFRAKIVIACLTLCGIAVGILPCLSTGIYGQKQNHTSVPVNVSLDENGTQSGNSSIITTYRNVTVTYIVYEGQCSPNNFYISNEARGTYKTTYTTLFLLSFLIVAVLYLMIYIFIMRHRMKKRRNKKLQSYVGMEKVPEAMPLKKKHKTRKISEAADVTSSPMNGSDRLNEKDTTRLTVPCTYADPESTQITEIPDSGYVENGNHDTPQSKTSHHRTPKISGKLLDKNTMANIRLAAMLFVVMIAFLITYLPALLMSLALVKLNRIVFYIYFSHNVVNPVIYCYMNERFRLDLKSILQCEFRRLG
ncbi:unnamed protein product [Owenia fusiformis]|uniref:Uncharacterized protein n=1 Tax=Owenia fusiformis TaxID=6347 RepID=A0A8J1TT62_OWEFU|nr:unnamed protein product [Owenia fusiformis]